MHGQQIIKKSGNDKLFCMYKSVILNGPRLRSSGTLCDRGW